jgi:hypothetical protein
VSARDPSRTFVALVHHPVYDKHRHIVSTALTNLDLHDIARSSRTYGLGGFLVVHPVEAQRVLASRILQHWADEGADRNDFRRQALERVTVVPTLADAVSTLTERLGQKPLVVATAARPNEKAIPPRELPHTAPILLVFGTGYGLTDELLAGCDLRLQPIEGPTDYNHLSVRSACAIYLDRLYGLGQD